MLDKEQLTKEEKVEQAKKLITDLNALELSANELRHVSAGLNVNYTTGNITGFEIPINS